MSQMSKSKAVKPSKAISKSKNELASDDDVTANGDSLTENSFNNLKNRISTQLKSIDQKTGKTPNPRKEKPQKQVKDTRGKKRTADGAVILTQKDQQAGDNHGPGREASGGNTDDELRAALKELGGTEEDLDLIAGAGSESELEGLEGETVQPQSSKKKGTTLEEGMANILKEIALAQRERTQDSSGSEDEKDSPEIDQRSVSESQKLQHKTPAPVADEKPSKKHKADSRFKCQPRADWFFYSAPSTTPDTELKHRPSQQSIDKLHNHAKTLLAAENEAFKNSQQSSSSQMFYNTVIASGTLSDKISALTLAVQESPLHNVKALENMIALAGKRSRAQAIDVLRALKDLFAQGFLLPGERRLYTFATQPTLLTALAQVKSWNIGNKLPRGIQESELIAWEFEDWLKQQYFEILKILEVWCNDEIEYARGRAVSYVYELLKEKPEQESNLLRLLVNKLGDPVKKIASQTSYLLMQLLSSHPAMKMVVISALESDFIFRPGQSMHGNYYAAVTLNQTVLSAREEEVAKKLLGIYFGLFTSLLKLNIQTEDAEDMVESHSRAQRQRKNKKSKPMNNAQDVELREKLISAVLTGVNRAYPYVGNDQKDFADHLETLFRITHSANFNTSIQAMLLIQQLSSTHSMAADRFYRTLYESLLDPRLITASKQQLYLNLLHRSLKADTHIKRTKAFVKRLLQILTLHDPSFICGVFFLLKDLEKTYPALTSLIDQAEDHDDEEEVFRDVDEEDPESANAGTAINEGTKHLYNGAKRAPEHANADNTCAWEVLPFLAHFHPSVTVSTDGFIQHHKIPGKPDLTLHTLIHFLDRFVYRNPKLAANKLRGSSIMQPMASDDTHAVLISAGSRQPMPAVNSDEFRNRKNDDVAAEEVFFHKYFTTLGKDVKAKKPKVHDDDEEGSVGDEGEDAVWKAMMDSAPDLEGEASGDEDLDMSDFEDEMADEDDLDGESGVGMDDLENEEDDEGVDIEAGIFDDSDDEISEELIESDSNEQSPDEAEFAGLTSEPEEGEGEDQELRKKKEKKKADKDRRKKMKALPTFASAADYAKMLDEDEDEDLA